MLRFTQHDNRDRILGDMVSRTHTRTAKKTKVLFVCIGNSCRSQMAEAWARHLASDVMAPASAGLTPLGEIIHTTRAVLEERGVGVEGQYSKSLPEADADAAEVIVNMSSHPIAHLFPGSKARIEDWNVADPYGEDLELYRQVRDAIEARVKGLAERLRKERQPAPTR